VYANPFFPNALGIDRDVLRVLVVNADPFIRRPLDEEEAPCELENLATVVGGIV
jgi:hypothetical protein